MNREKEPIHPLMEEWVRLETRRQFLRQGANALGMAALARLGGTAFAASLDSPKPGGRGAKVIPGAIPKLNFPVKAKHVIYLHMVGGPPQLDLFDYKPELVKMYDKDLPDSVRNGQRLTGMTSGQARFPISPSFCPIPQKWPTTCASFARCTRRRSTTNPRSRTCRPATR
jgi:Protein of unknown function (DUF1501)